MLYMQRKEFQIKHKRPVFKSQTTAVPESQKQTTKNLLLPKLPTSTQRIKIKK